MDLLTPGSSHSLYPRTHSHLKPETHPPWSAYFARMVIFGMSRPSLCESDSHQEMTRLAATIRSPIPQLRIMPNVILCNLSLPLSFVQFLFLVNTIKKCKWKHIQKNKFASVKLDTQVHVCLQFKRRRIRLSVISRTSFFFCIVYLAPINMQSIFVYLLVLFKLFVFVWAQGNNQGDIIYPTPGTVWHVGQEVNVVCF